MGVILPALIRLFRQGVWLSLALQADTCKRDIPKGAKHMCLPFRHVRLAEKKESNLSCTLL